MKFYLRIFVLMFFIAALSSPLAAQTTSGEMKWYGWNEGYEKAVKEGKIVLVDAYTDWCGWCKKMDRDTYSKPEVISKINQHFIPVKFNPEIEGVKYKIGEQEFSGAELYSILTQGKPTGFPSTYYIYPALRKLFYDAGYKGPEQFLEILNAAVEEGKKQ